MRSTADPKTLILSDLHLGRPNATAQAHRFAELATGFERVIVNGDVAELHHAAFRDRAELELARLRDFVEQKGARLELIAGNHDAFVSPVRSLELAGGSVYITHGDAVHPAIAPWSPYAAAMRDAYATALAASGVGDDEHRSRLMAAREASLAEWRGLGDGAYISTVAGMAVRPHRALAVLGYWLRYPGLVHDWVERYAPHADTVIVGHSHRAFVRTVGGRRMVNTGAYSFPGRPLAVVVDGTELRVHRIDMERRLFRLSTRPIASWEITPKSTRGSTPAIPRGEPGPAYTQPSARLMNDAASASAAPSTDVR